MLSRRELLKVSAQTGIAIALPSAPFFAQTDEPGGIEVNDVQSHLNATRVHEIKHPRSIDDVQIALREAQRQGRAVSVAGGRHAMGTQQFGSDALLLDTRDLKRVVKFDKETGRITVEAGIEWPELIEYLVAEQAGQQESWAIREKQTGVDRVSL